MPQLVAPWSTQIVLGSTVPVGTLVQVPTVPASAHDLQEALHVVAQQKPCAQKVDPHSAFAEHGAPIGFVPHELTLQTLGLEQFADVEHAEKHFEPLHA